MATKLDLKTLSNAISGNAVGLRSRSRLEPAGGPDDKVFPPTYAGGSYAHEFRKVHEDGETVRKRCVLLNSVQSEANAIEEAMQDAIDEGRLKLPVVETDFGDQDIVPPGSEEPGLYEPIGRLTHFETPHRIVDAILRDSELDGTAFRDSDIGRELNLATIRNATPLFKYCPHSLVLGIWDSTGPKGGLGFKFQRALVSEIVAVDVECGTKTSSRIDPLAIRKDAALLYADADEGWTLEKKAKAKLLGKDGKPSEANHGNIVPSLSDRKRDPLDSDNDVYLAGGVTMDYAERTTVISFPALRRLRFPLDPNGRPDPEVNAAARTALAALGICGAVLASERGIDLRSRCFLNPTEPIEWELLGKPGEPPVTVQIDADAAISLCNEAFEAARKAGLDWLAEPLTLRPSAKLVTLVRNSQQKAVQESGASE